METIELTISSSQKEKLQEMCDGESDYVAMAQILLNEAIDKE